MLILIRKIRRKLQRWNWNWLGILWLILGAAIFFLLFLKSGPPAPVAPKERKHAEASEIDRIPLETDIIVDQPICKIQSFSTNTNSKEMEPLHTTTPFKYTFVTSLADGTSVVYKETSLEEQACVQCCFRAFHINMEQKSGLSPKSLQADLEIMRNVYCRSFVKLAQLRSTVTNFVQTICEVQCGWKDQDRPEGNPIIRRLHPLLNSNPSTKVRLKVNYWNQKRVERHPYSILLLSLDSLSRAEARALLPKSVQLMEEQGFVDLRGYSLIGGDWISNFVGGLTGLKQEDWDEACGVSETRTFSYTCPWIWKDFGRARYITAYFEDVSGQRSGLRRQEVRFVESPTDFYLGQDLGALLNETSSFSSLDMLLQYTAQFNAKFKDFPTFSITRLPSSPELDTQLKQLLIGLQGLKNTFVALYSNSGPLEASNRTNGPSLERIQPVLFAKLYENPDRARVPASFHSVLRKNSDRLVTVLDLYETLRHLLRLSCFPAVEYDAGNTTTACFQRFVPLAGARSLIMPVSVFRTCSTAGVPPETCLCNRLLGAVPPTPLPMSTDMLVKAALGYLNEFVPKNGTCSNFGLQALLYVYPLQERTTAIEVTVGLAVGGESGTGKLSAEMRVEVRLSIVGRGEGTKFELVPRGLPLWISANRPNGHQCLPFSVNPKLFYLDKSFCLCN